MANRRSNALHAACLLRACGVIAALSSLPSLSCASVGHQPTGRAGATAGAAVETARGVDRVLLDRELRARRVWLLSIEGGLVTYRDADGLVQSEPIGELVGLTTPLEALSSASMQPPVPRVELVDGLRLPGVRGSSALGDAAGESLVWRTPTMGPVVLALAEVRRVVFQEREGAGGAGGVRALVRDRVRLVNGDELEGFVTRLGSELDLEDATGAVRTLALGLVSEVELANPSEPAGGMVAWLAGGGVVRVERIGRDASGDVRLVLPGGDSASEAGTEAVAVDVRVPLPDVYAIAFDARVLAPLATIEASRVLPEAGRRWTAGLSVSDPDLAPLRLGDVEIPGPMSVEWPVPAGASRFATTVTLPRAMRVWGDCVVTFELIDARGGVLALDSRRVQGSDPTQRVIVAFPEPRDGGAGRVLRVSVRSGERGPIQDRPVLESPVFLIETNPEG